MPAFRDDVTRGSDSAYNDAAMETSRTLSRFRQSLADSADARSKLKNPAFDRAALGVMLEYERMGNRPVSEALDAQARARGVRFEHLGLTLGTVLHGMDLQQPMSGEDTGFVRRALLERKVIFFRNQHLSEDDLERFARGFGSLDAFPFGASGANPYVLEIRHGPLSPGRENTWHTDVTWMESPSMGSIAQCEIVPPYGGDTLFSDSHAACLGLTEPIRERLEHLQGINDYRIFLAGRGAHALPDELIRSIKDRIPFGVSHPLLRTHPETGKTALYIHGGFLRHDSLFDARTGKSIGAQDSKNLVRELLTQHARPEYICRFRWEPGSVAFWDNRAVQHYASSDYFPHERLLRRVTVSGDRPFYRP